MGCFRWTSLDWASSSGTGTARGGRAEDVGFTDVKGQLVIFMFLPLQEASPATKDTFRTTPGDGGVYPSSLACRMLHASYKGMGHAAWVSWSSGFFTDRKLAFQSSTVVMVPPKIAIRFEGQELCCSYKKSLVI